MPTKAEGVVTTTEHRLMREFLALLLLFGALFLSVSVISYHPQDPSFNQAAGQSHQLQNAAGVVGAYLGGFLVEYVGLSSFLLVLGLFWAGVQTLIPRFATVWWRWPGLGLLILCLAWWASNPWAEGLILGHVQGGGFIGAILYDLSRLYLRPIGSWIVWIFLTLISLQLIFGLLFTRHGAGLALGLSNFWAGFQGWIFNLRGRVAQLFYRKKDEKPLNWPQSRHNRTEAAKLPPPIVSKNTTRSEAPTAAKVVSKPSRPGRGYNFPPLDILHLPQATGSKVSRDALERQAQRLVECLADFGVQGQVQRITPGPVVTMFEYKPAPGVKISRIANLSDDLALAMKALAVRIEAPIPGTDVVGVEIPSDEQQMVYLREIFASSEFQKSKALLPLALGKDIAGRPQTADLSRMPHLLVAGATGTGKSVCLNALLLSFLYKATPDEVQLLLIDPKRIELAVFAELPHLVHPVVTDMALAKNALDWAVHEMDRRYEAMAKLGVRNIVSYNEKLENLGDKRPEELEDLSRMPFLVVVIDELADLMLTSAKDVETSIVRLAQLARAAGIHLIIATQRPSVDVVTGLIKANFPCRISFQVPSRHDSRTILDMSGAEYLLGRGDMLFKPSGGKLQRVHGAFATDEEVAAVVDFWKAQKAPLYELDFSQWGAGQGGPGIFGDGEDLSDDPMYSEAVEFVLQQGNASISKIQRRFRIGFNRAARVIEQMEAEGIIGPADGSKPRQVLK